MSLVNAIRRLEDNTYANFESELKNVGNAALANCVYGRDFIKNLYDNSGGEHYGFKSTDDGGSEFSAIVFGEVQSASQGTRLGATGAIPSGKPIYDSTVVKDVVVLSAPKEMPRGLSEFYDKQCEVLRTIREQDENEETQSWKAKEWLDTKTVGPDGSRIIPPENRIVIQFPPKFGKPKKSGEKHGGTSDDAGSSSSHTIDIEEGAVYTPSLLPNFENHVNDFHLVKAKLLQHKILDEDSGLIPPWEYWDHLRPGTLVAVNVSPRVWVWPNSAQKIYQLNVKFLRVLAPSDLPPEDPVVVDAATAGRDQSKRPRAAAENALASFTVAPSQKRNRFADAD